MMAIYKNGKKSGKEGEVIHSSWHGRAYTRRMPATVANPQTEAQQAHRRAFAEISRLSAGMKNAHSIGLHWKAVREKLNTHSVFRTLNKDCYGVDGVDYSRVRISFGTVSAVTVTSAAVDALGIVSVSFSSHHAPTEANDEVYLFVYCPDQREGRLAHPVGRGAGCISAELPAEWRGHVVHLYAFVKSTRSRTSETIYIGPFGE